MTRKHFTAIAHALRVERPDPIATEAYQTWQRVVRTMADVCASTNGAFDRGRFYMACGYDR
jgi:hypothetical protein